VADHFAPRIIVGNTLNGDPALAQAAPFQYIPDPGNGSGITAALAAASSGFDVYIRPGTYTIPVGVHFTIPAGVRVRGEPAASSGLSGTVIVGSAGDATNTQDVFTLGLASALEDVTINVPAGAAQGAAGVAIILIPSIAISLRRITVNMVFGGNGQRNTTTGIWTGTAAAPGTGNILEDTDVILPPVASGVGVYAGIVHGNTGVDSVIAGVRGPTLRNCRVSGGQFTIAFFNINEPQLTDCFVDGLILSSAGSNGFYYFLDAVAASVVTGWKCIGCRGRCATTGDAANATAAMFAIENAVTQTGTILRGWVIDGFQIIFETAGGLLGARQGIKVRIEDSGTGQNNDWVIGAGTITGAQIDILIQSLTNTNDATATGSINDGVVADVTGRGYVTYGANIGQGVAMDISNVAQAKINRVSIVGSNFSGAGAAQTGIAIAANVTNTIVSSNQLTPGAGTAINDLGTNTQIIGNIVT
jgi:hypothetical protein